MEIKEIKCPIFRSKNKDIEGVTKAINEVEDVKKKAQSAEGLIREAGQLLSCKHFDIKIGECEICHYIANLRKQAVNLIIRTSRSVREP